MMEKNKTLSDLRESLGQKPLSRSWAKTEVLLGLLAVGVGLLLGNWAVTRTGEVPWPLAGAGLLLSVLGGYLTLAGHRSHLYQSNNELTAYLAKQIRSLQEGNS